MAPNAGRVHLATQVAPRPGVGVAHFNKPAENSETPRVNARTGYPVVVSRRTSHIIRG